jgi:segregation and condensation protein A
MTYQVRLSQFEGPLDLLLHLIRRDKINIYDIPIAHITHEYLAYIDVMKELQLELAGEFFVMAAVQGSRPAPRRAGTRQAQGLLPPGDKAAR